MNYVKTIKTTLRKTNNTSGAMDDYFTSKKELDKIDLAFYKSGSLIFIEDENQVYRIHQKEVLTLKK
jgi:hypothetical protein